MEDPFVELYSTEDNAKLLTIKSDRERKLMIRPPFWTKDSQYLLFGPLNMSFIYDIANRNVKRVINMDRHVIGWNYGVSQIVVYRSTEKKFVIEDTLTGDKIAEYSENK